MKFKMFQFKNSKNTVVECLLFCICESMKPSPSHRQPNKGLETKSVRFLHVLIKSTVSFLSTNIGLSYARIQF